MARNSSAAAQAAPSEEAITVIGRRNGLELAVKHRSKRTLGSIITQVPSADLIAGVVVEPLQIYADDRGFFAELARLGTPGTAANMIPDAQRQIQISATLSYPGTIKAIHYHYEQSDLWAPVAGMLQVFLSDLRSNSPTFGAINTLYVGKFRPWRILIPPGVAHGYKVIGAEPAQLVYLTDRYHNPEDEGRLPHDHPGIGYDWETQHK